MLAEARSAMIADERARADAAVRELAGDGAGAPLELRAGDGTLAAYERDRVQGALRLRDETRVVLVEGRCSSNDALAADGERPREGGAHEPSGPLPLT